MKQRYVFACLGAIGNFLNLAGRNCLNLAVVSISEEWRHCHPTPLHPSPCTDTATDTATATTTAATNFTTPAPCSQQLGFAKQRLKEMDSWPIPSPLHAGVPLASLPLLLPPASYNSDSCTGDWPIEWTDDAIATVLGAFFWGIFFAEVVSGPLVDLVGGHRTMLVANVVAGLSTLATPWLVEQSLLGLVTCQVIAGLAMGVAVPSFHSLLGRWEPAGERGRLATIIYTGSPLSSIICLLLTGWLIKIATYSLPFYILGGLTLAWLPFWAFLVTDSPFTQRFITQDELSLYNGKKAGEERPSLRQIPWSSILTSAPVWAAIFANTAFTQAFSFTASLLPQIYGSVYHLPTEQSGLILALPFLLNYIISYLASLASSLLLNSGTSLLAVRRLNTTISLLGMAASFVLLPSLGDDGGLAVTVTLISVGYGLTGFQLGGAWCSPIDLAPNFAATVMGLSGLCSYSLASFLPLLFSQLVTTTAAVSGWSFPLYLTGALLGMAAGVFLLAGKADEQSWNKISNLLEDEETKL